MSKIVFNQNQGGGGNISGPNQHNFPEKEVFGR
jgi:hypothetical protein